MVDALYRRLSARQSELTKFDKYYRGEQPLVMASDSWRRFHHDRFRDFSDNWCAVVADATSQRLRMTGFRLPDEVPSADGDLLWRSWLDNELDSQSSQGFLETVKSRRSYALVWHDRESDGPLVTWEDPSQVIVAYDPENSRRPVRALKAWQDENVRYATLYTPTHIWKFSRRQSWSGLIVAGAVDGWEPREVVGEPWPLPNPMGEVPIVEFPNRPLLRGEPLSEIAGVVPMQDAINLLWAYMFAAADYASLPARVVLGMEAPSLPILDANGQDTGQRRQIPLEELERGRLLFLAGEPGDEPKIGQYDAARLNVFTDVVEIAVGHVAAQTRTPQDYLVVGSNANPPAADTVSVADRGLLSKVKECQQFLNSPARRLFALMAKVWDTPALADACRYGMPIWEDAENQSEAQRADAAQKWGSLRMGDGSPVVSRRTLLERYMRMTPAEASDEIARVENERDGAEDLLVSEALRQLQPSQ
jgi:hypothetical protein